MDDVGPLGMFIQDSPFTGFSIIILPHENSRLTRKRPLGHLALDALVRPFDLSGFFRERPLAPGQFLSLLPRLGLELFGQPLDEGWAIFDFDYDEDVDFADFGGFGLAFTGEL